MPKPAWEDLSVFLQTQDFADTAAIQRQAPIGGGDVPEVDHVDGIFDDPYMDAQTGEYQMDTREPRFWCQESHVAGVRRGDTAVIDGRTFDIMSEPQSDGTGMAMLKLEEQV